jgi:peptidoglycan/xylan/chitin deacetylase (PgdA/CDA1 family)
VGIARRLAALHFPRVLEEHFRGRMAANHGIALMYHEVLPDEMEDPIWTVLTESRFQRQMLHLRHHYDVLSIDEAVERLSAPVSKGRPFAAVTFDDGYRGNLTCVLPVMESLDLPFTVFVATRAVQTGQLHWYDRVILYLLGCGRRRCEIPTSRGVVRYASGRSKTSRRWAGIRDVLNALKSLPEDERRQIAQALPATASASPLAMLSKAELTSLAASPLVDIGCHTHGHELLDGLPMSDARDSILTAQKLLTEALGRPPRHFAYPNGNYNGSTVDLVKECGFATAFTVQPRLWTRSDSLWEVPRIGVGRFDNQHLFRAVVSGALRE